MNIRTFFRRLKNPELDLIDFMNLAYLGKKPYCFHGHTQLDLLRDGKVVHRVEKDNEITGWIGDALSAGNFFNQIAANKIYPLSQWFNGCYLTDSANDATTSMLAGNTNIVAQAGDDAYSGLNLKRGSFNIIESGSGINNGKCFIRNVWDWNTSQGNCAQGQSIASVCLTRGGLGKVELNDSTTFFDSGAEMLPIQPLSSSFSLSSIPFNVLDYENEKAYNVVYSSGTFTITEYDLNTRRIHVYGDLFNSIETATHTISQTVDSFDSERFSLWLNEDGIHFFSWSNSGSNVTIKDYLININNWTISVSTYTFAGLNIYGSNAANMYGIMMIDDNGYLWAYGSANVNGTNSDVFAKLNLSNIADVSVYVDPRFTYYGVSSTYSRGNFILLPNGNFIHQPFYWSGQRNHVMIYGNTSSNKFYMSAYDTEYRVMSYKNTFLTRYGTVLSSRPSDNSESFLCALFPYVSTVNNLQNPVRKTADLSMKLTYTITEV